MNRASQMRMHRVWVVAELDKPGGEGGGGGGGDDAGGFGGGGGPHGLRAALPLVPRSWCPGPIHLTSRRAAVMAALRRRPVPCWLELLR